MNLKNEKSKIYHFGQKFFIILLIILGLFYFSNKINSELSFKLVVLQQICFSLFLVLLGTKQIIAKQDRNGFLYYISAVIMLIFIITPSLIK